MSNPPSVGNFVGRKLKRKIEESSIIKQDLHLSLSLNLSSNYAIHESSSKPSFKSLKSNVDLGFDSKEHQFCCKFCDKKFLSPQALGGHQNTHRRERILSMTEKEFPMSTFGLSAYSCSCPSIANHHFHGSPLHHKGHMHLMAHMNHMPWRSFEFGGGNKELHNTNFSANQFGMTSNSLGRCVETPQRLNHRDIDQVPSLTRYVLNRSITTNGDLEGLP
ncbi:hypothetical protein TanjilG_27384 [Lupinus angustifolius]|uniref:C2H2-type domain-containing protein n=1 Tax=Lupinus angustifolius TaxID=3871 RepID=A0A394DMG8_LUPAN|nr:hypothetical protein TanjilG_27384 [Lupinus angustifolius]